MVTVTPIFNLGKVVGHCQNLAVLSHTVALSKNFLIELAGNLFKLKVSLTSQC
jgi:hypothetical protein